MEIEFGAVTDKNAQKYAIKRNVIATEVGVAIGCLTCLILGFVFAKYSDLVLPIVIAVCPVVLLFGVLAKPKAEVVIPESIIIHNNEIECKNKVFDHLRYTEEIKVIYDYGKFYVIKFYFPHKSEGFICQKDAITKGTIEEFETLFNDYIVRKPIRERKRRDLQ